MTSEKSILDKIKGYLLPYHQCHYYSKLSKDEILSRINKKTEPEQFYRMKGWLFGSSKTKEFEGTVGQNEFKINKISKKRTYYSPVLMGRLSSAGQFTKVDISMRLSYVILLIVPLYLLFFANYIFNLDFSFNNFNEANFASWIPILFVFLFYAFLVGSFHYHIGNVKKSLIRIIEPVDEATAESEGGASWIVRN